MDDRTNISPEKQMQPELQRFREYFTATIALIIVLGFVILVIIAFFIAAKNSDKAFDQIKDLLLFINPIVGIVIGYYFNKATSEARAEKAESRVDSAVKEAEKAGQERDTAIDKVNITERRMEEVTNVLDDISTAAEKMIEEDTGGPPGVLSAEDDSYSRRPSSARLELENALKRAQKIRV